MIIEVKVKPATRQSSLEQLQDGSWYARLKSRPVDGKANNDPIALVADYFSLAKSQVSIKIGAGARIKRIILDD